MYIVLTPKHTFFFLVLSFIFLIFFSVFILFIFLYSNDFIYLFIYIILYNIVLVLPYIHMNRPQVPEHTFIKTYNE